MTVSAPGVVFANAVAVVTENRLGVVTGNAVRDGNEGALDELCGCWVYRHGCVPASGPPAVAHAGTSEPAAAAEC